MQEGGDELALTMVRLRVAVVDAGLRDGEAEALLALPAGEWATLAAPDCALVLSGAQERRARQLIELLGFLQRRVDGDGDGKVAYWLRGPRRGLAGESPLNWLGRDRRALPALIRAVREVTGA